MTEEVKANERIFQIPIEVEDGEFLNMLNFVVNNSFEPLFEDPNKPKIHQGAVSYKRKIDKYNAKIIKYIEKTKKCLHNKNFFETYADKPLLFIQNFMLQQNTLLNVIKFLLFTL